MGAFPAVNSGIAFGLVAALCWGIADFCARGSSRAGGTFLTLLAIQVVAVAALLGIALPLGLLSLSAMPLGMVLAAAGVSLAILAGAGFLYRAFAIGTLALASPIAASFAAITALLALVTGERPALTQLVGIALTLGGVVLASSVSTPTRAEAGKARALPTDPAIGGRWRVTWHPEPGLIEALASMLIFGVAYWALRFVVGALGGVRTAFIGKVTDLLALSVIALVGASVARRRSRSLATPRWYAPRRPPFAFWLFVVPAALLDTTANIAYNLGITRALVSVVVVLSSLFSAVTVLLAWIFLRERLRGWQWVGVSAIFVGIVLVSR
ncbi:MAG: DMT family transporter [Ktedonobacterales bacterium]|nr:DMT family transporter [Ktedonobacterales bacterium]